MTALARKIVVDAAATEFATDVVNGLTATPKRLSPKYFYDHAGSDLFEQITELPEYYPTRTEVGILNAHAADIAALIPPNAALIEFGSGSSTKTRIVLSAAETLGAYVPVDISGAVPAPAGGGAAARISEAQGASGRRRFHQAVRSARRRPDDAAGRLFPGLDHRQFRAARGGGVPAPCRPHPRRRRDVHRRRRSGQGHRRCCRRPTTIRRA